jgi:hypothetical protein
VADVDVASLVKDPEFQKFPLEERVSALQKAGVPDEFINEYKSLNTSSAVPTTTATMTSGPSTLDTIREGIRQALQTKIPNAALVTAGLVAPPLIPMATTMAATGGTPEGLLEMLPAAGAMAGMAAGGDVPAAGVLAAGGEALRQHIRRAVGLPAATGLVQRLLHLDPNSPEAAEAGMGAEGVVTPLAEGVSSMARKLGDWSHNLGLRWLLTQLDPSTQLDKGKALELAERMQSEGIPGIMRGREAQLKAATDALGSARTEQSTALAAAKATGKDIPTAPVVKAVQDNFPPVNPSTGQAPLSDAAGRVAAERAAKDAAGALGMSQVDIDTAIAQRQFWDDLQTSARKTGRIPGSGRLSDINNISNGWRAAINDTFPEIGALGEKNQKLSELITVTKLLRENLQEIRSKPLLNDVHSIRSFLYRPIRTALSSGPAAAMGSNTVELLSKILAGGSASAEAWVRMSDPFNAQLAKYDPNSKDEENQPSSVPDMIDTLRSAGKPTGNPTPQPSAGPSVTEDSFLRKYGYNQ